MLKVFSEFVVAQDQRLDECAPGSSSRYDFCEKEREAYQLSQEHVERGYVHVGGGRTRPYRYQRNREIIEEKSVWMHFETSKYGDQFLSLPATTVFDFLYSHGLIEKEDVLQQFAMDLEPMIEAEIARAESLEGRYATLTGYGEIAETRFQLGNLWPMVISVALGMKIARVRYRFFWATRS